MNPFFQANTPTTKEMWKNEPNKYRQWIILFGISMIIFLTLTLIGLILVFMNKDSLHTSITNSLENSKNSKGDPSKVATQRIIFSFIAIPIIMIVMTIASTGLYGITLLNSYKEQTFSKLSGPAIYLPQFIGMFSLFGAIFSSYNVISMVEGNVGAILSIVAQYFSIILLVFAWQVSKIRKTFIHIERMEALKKSPEFQQMQEQMKTFFNAAQSGQTPSSAYGPTPETPKAKVKESDAQLNDAPEVVELKKLKKAELIEIANKLSISGSDKMSKDELVATIVRVTNES